MSLLIQCIFQCGPLSWCWLVIEAILAQRLILEWNGYIGELFVSVFQSFEGRIDNTISSLKWQKNSIIYDKIDATDLTIFVLSIVLSINFNDSEFGLEVGPHVHVYGWGDKRVDSKPKVVNTFINIGIYFVPDDRESTDSNLTSLQESGLSLSLASLYSG